MLISKPPQKNIIVIGLDGLPLSLLLHLTKNGSMPRIRDLMEKGSYGKLRSVIPPITPAAWTSFQTGKYPYSHGVVDFLQFTPWTHEYSFTNSTSITGQTFWSILNYAGRKQIVVNVPLTYPPEEVDGIIIPGFDTPVTKQGNSAHPEGIIDVILKNVNEYRFFSSIESINLFRNSGLKTLSDELLDVTRSQVESVKYLIKTYDWDFLMYHFQVTDMMQHLAWEYIDPECDCSVKNKDTNNSIIREFYRKIDDMVGELLDQVGQDATVCLLSDHGFIRYDTTFYLNLFLKKKGYVFVNPFYPFIRTRDNILRKLKNLNIPLTKKQRPSPSKISIRTFRKIDFQKTTAYAYTNSMNYAFIFINKNLHLNIESLKLDLLGIRHEGKPIVKDIYPWYEGRATGIFNPDLVVEFSEGFSVKQRLSSGSHPLFEKMSESGNHSIDGMFCFTGNGIKNKYQTSAEIVSIMPTLLSIMEVPIPKEIDGKVIEDIFITQQDSTYTESTDHSKHHKTVGEADFDAVATMLRSLGYLQ